MNARNHIIDFSKAANRGKKEKGSRALPVLVKKVQNIFVAALKANLIDMLDSADDRLFDMAENSHNNAQFDAMRLLRVKREALISGFVKELSNNFDSTLCKNNIVSSEDGLEDISVDNIALVKDDDLEEDIATDAMIKKSQQLNQHALQNIRIRLDTFFSDRSIEQDNNPLEPFYICNAFRNSTQQLDIDITSLLVIYKLFERSIMSQLDSTYEQINDFFIENGILPELKIQASKASSQSNKEHNNHSNTIDNLPVNQNQDDLAAAQSAEVLSVIQQLLAEQRTVSVLSPQINSGNHEHKIPSLENGLASTPVESLNEIRVDTIQLVKALSNLQNLSGNASNLNQAVASAPDLRSSINHQLPNLIDSSSRGNSLGQFNEDMIDIVSMLFDFILDDDNLQPEIKSVLGRLQIPMLKVGLIDKSFLSNRKHPARMLLNELAHAGLAWDKNDKTAEPMLQKITGIAEKIIVDFNDEIDLFEELLSDFKAFKKQYQQRSLIFERRVKESEEGKAKTESARGAVNNRLAIICNHQYIPNAVKLILKKVWSHVMLLERLKENKEAWQRRVKVAKLLVWSVQPVETAMQLEQMTSRVPLLIKSLRKGMEIISFSEIEASYLFDELEGCHREIINVAREKINAQVLEDNAGEEILRLPAINVEQENLNLSNENHENHENILDSESKQKSVDREFPTSKHNDDSLNLSISEEIIIEDIGFTSAQIGEVINVALEETIYIDDKTRQTIEQLRAGSWLELCLNGKFVRCKLVARIASTGKHIFVNRNGIKVAELLIEELCVYLQQGKLKVFDDDALFDRALESVISNLRSMKAQA